MKYKLEGKFMRALNAIIFKKKNMKVIIIHVVSFTSHKNFFAEALINSIGDKWDQGSRIVENRGLRKHASSEIPT